MKSSLRIKFPTWGRRSTVGVKIGVGNIVAVAVGGNQTIVAVDVYETGIAVLLGMGVGLTV